MCASLPASDISFDLYSSCPFEAVEVLGPQSDVNEGVQFDDSALSGPSVAPPVYFDHFGSEGRSSWALAPRPVHRQLYEVYVLASGWLVVGDVDEAAKYKSQGFKVRKYKSRF